MRPSRNPSSVSVATSTLLLLFLLLMLILPTTTTALAAARSISQQQHSSGHRSRTIMQLPAEDNESQETNAIEQNSSSGRYSEVADNGEVQTAAQGRLLDWLEEVSDAIQNFQSQVDWRPEELVRQMEEFMQMELDTIQSLLDDSEIGRQLQDIMDNMMMLFTPIPGGLSGAHRRSLLSSPLVTPRRGLDSITSHRAVAPPHQLYGSRKLLNLGAIPVDFQNLEQSDDVQQQPFAYLLDGEDGTKYDDLDISQLMDLYPADLREAGVLGDTNTSPEDSPLPEEDNEMALTKSLLDVDVSELMLLQPHVITGFEGQLDLLEDLIDAMQRTMAKLGDAIAIGIQSSDAPIYLDTPWLDIYPDDYNMAPPSVKHGKMAAQHKPYAAGNAPGYADNDYQHHHFSTTATTVPLTTLAAEPQPAFDTIPRGMVST